MILDYVMMDLGSWRWSPRWSRCDIHPNLLKPPYLTTQSDGEHRRRQVSKTKTKNRIIISVFQKSECLKHESLSSVGLKVPQAITPPAVHVNSNGNLGRIWKRSPPSRKDHHGRIPSDPTTASETENYVLLGEQEPRPLSCPFPDKSLLF